MSPLVESLRAEDGRFDDLTPHRERMIRARRAIFGLETVPDLDGALEEVRDRLGDGVWKVRVIYDPEIRTVEAAPYEPRPYRSAALVDGGSIAYPHKWTDRSALDALQETARAAGADAALIVVDGRITDFTWANSAFFDGRRWFTPALPLLAGTRRDRLLAAGRMETADIRPADLGAYVSACPINAMMDLGEVEIPIDRIIVTESGGQP